jgi:ABC-2 type transport system permease protein
MPLSMLPHWLQVVAPALPTYHLAQIALAVFGFAPASGMALHWAVLGGFTVLMLAAAWITFQRSEANN